MVSQFFNLSTGKAYAEVLHLTIMNSPSITTLIFLSQRRYEYCHIEKLSRQLKCRLIALLTNENYQAFPNEMKRYFNKLYCVEMEKNCGELAQYTLNLTAACHIIEAEIKKAHGAEKIRIICHDEANISLAGYLRSRYQIPGPKYTEVLPYRDKVLMKTLLQDTDVRTPRFIQLDKTATSENAENYYHEITQQIGKKFIIKPIDGAASATTLPINSLKDFQHCLTQINSNNTVFEAEEFIQGTLFHCDSLYQHGQCLVAIVSQYSVPNLEFVYGKTLMSVPLLPENPLVSRILEANQKITSRLGTFDGARHLELFITTQKDEIVFLEIAGRLPGAIAVPSIERMYGINLLDLCILIHADITIEKIPLHFKIGSFFGMIPFKTGKVTKLNTPNINSNIEIDWTIKLEQQISLQMTQSVRHTAGNFLVSNASYSQLIKDFEFLASFNFYEVI